MPSYSCPKLITFNPLTIHDLLSFSASACFIFRSFSFFIFQGNQFIIAPASFLSFLLVLSEISCGIFYLLSKKETINSEKLLEHDKNKKEQIQGETYFSEKLKETHSYKVFIQICFFAILDLISFYLIERIHQHNHLDIVDSFNVDSFKMYMINVYKEMYLTAQMRPSEFIFVCILAYIFLKFKPHRHHVVSFCFIFLAYFMIFPYGIFGYFNQDENNLQVYVSNFEIFKKLFMILISSAFISIQQTGEKWLMENKFVPIYKLRFITGLFNLIILIPIIIIEEILISDSSHYRNFSFFFTQKNIFSIGVLVRILIFILSSLGYNICILLINKYKGPNHLVITDTVSSILVAVLLMIINVKNGNNLQIFTDMFGLKICGYLFIICGFCVYNELIILNFFGLGKNTTKAIMKRGCEEDGIVIGMVGCDLMDESKLECSNADF